jgi:hypothetical protein
MTETGSTVAPAPMNIGQILDRTYRLMRVYWRSFFEIALMPAIAVFGAAAVAMGLLSTLVLPQILHRGNPLPHIPVYFPVILLATFNLIPIPVYSLYLPAGIYAATQANLGLNVTLREAYGMAWRHYRRYLWLLILIALYVWIPLGVVSGLIAGGVILITHGSAPGTIPIAIFMLVPAAFLAYFGIMAYCLFIMLRFSIAYPACVVEDISARAALRRSIWLTSGGRGRIFLVLLVVYAATYAASMIFVTVCGAIMAFGMLAATAAHVTPDSPAFWICIGMGVLAYLGIMVIYSALAYSAFNAALAVMYHDQRWRKDSLMPSTLPA